MPWFDEQGLKHWFSHISRKRKELSESVEEALKDTAVQGEDWDEEDGDEMNIGQAKDTTLIPPRLSLQSKPMPAVLPNARNQSQVHPATSSSLGIARSGNLSTAVLPTTEIARGVPGNQRLGGRSTKVHLQVVAKPEHTPLPAETHAPHAPFLETKGYSMHDAAHLFDEVLQLPQQAILTGTGTFEAEQSDAAVLNGDVTSTSVVLATLTGDPGHVVVKYISLQPGFGFTVHLTAPTSGVTPFNYAILNGR
jgi:hypothetical protein